MGVGLTRLQNYAWERWLIRSVWVALCLECNSSTIGDWLAKLVVVRAIEEVAAVELQTYLVGQHLHTTAALW